jgi:hypothetical protein
MNLRFTLLLISSIAIASEAQVAPSGMSKEEWKLEQEFRNKLEIKEKAKFNNELKDNPPKPPWIKYPEHSMIDMFWRMGEGESYLMDYVWLYLKYASDKELKEYKNKYPEPNDWKGWYN